MENEYSRFIEPLQKEQEDKEAEVAKLKDDNEKLREIITRLDRRLQNEHEERMIDPLTGLPNWSAFVKKFDELSAVHPRTAEHRRKQEKQEVHTIVALDLDGFKEANDALGHDAGDNVLKEFSQSLKKIFRDNDFVTREHGDEFLVICPNTRAEDVINRFRELEGEAGKARPQHQARLPFELEIPQLNRSLPTVKITCSAGLVEILPGAKEEDLPAIIKRADDARYQAKRAGKNQMIFAEDQNVTEEP